MYLSTTPTITANSILLGAAPHSGGLNANASYDGTFSAPVPALEPGSYYVLVEVDSLYQVSERPEPTIRWPPPASSMSAFPLFNSARPTQMAPSRPPTRIITTR